jgi:hypothetical protein
MQEYGCAVEIAERGVEPTTAQQGTPVWRTIVKVMQWLLEKSDEEADGNVSEDRTHELSSFPGYFERKSLQIVNEAYAFDFVKFGYQAVCVDHFHDAIDYTTASGQAALVWSDPLDCIEIRSVVEAGFDTQYEEKFRHRVAGIPYEPPADEDA